MFRTKSILDVTQVRAEEHALGEDGARINLVVTERREVFLQFTIWLLLTVTSSYAIFWGWLGNTLLSVSCTLTFLSSFALLFRRRLGISYSSSARIILATAAVCIYVTAVANWQSSPIMACYFATSPMAASLLLGRRAAVNWSIITSILTCLLPVGSRYLNFDLHFSPLQMDLFNMAQTLTMLFTIGSLLFLLERLSSDLVTTLIENKLALEKTQSELIGIQQARNRFFANISHEIRTPMNAIRGISELLEDNPGLDTEGKSLVFSLNRSSIHLLSLINDLLDLSKLEESDPQFISTEFDLREVIYDAYNIVRYAANQKALDFRLEIDTNLPKFIIGDPNRLRQILVNLLNNAVKFTERGFVLLCCELDARPIASQTQHTLRIQVHDTGIGIADDAQDKIFQGYAQASSHISEQYGGTGLGLSITRKIVELQGGKIWLESRVGQGSRFYIDLPITPSKTIKHTMKSAEAAFQFNHVCTIMLVEDNALNIMVAQKLISKHMPNCTFLVAHHGQEALDLLAQNNIPDLILMDMHMPVLDGIATTKIIRAHTRSEIAQLPIIAMTANTSKEDVDNCYAAGMNDFVYKPFDTQVLLLKISKLMRHLPADPTPATP